MLSLLNQQPNDIGVVFVLTVFCIDLRAPSAEELSLSVQIQKSVLARSQAESGWPHYPSLSFTAAPASVLDGQALIQYG